MIQMLRDDGLECLPGYPVPGRNAFNQFIYRMRTLGRVLSIF